MELATAEFAKIFRAKSGNVWETSRTAATFVPIPGKYQLQFVRRSEVERTLLVPIHTILAKAAGKLGADNQPLPPGAQGPVITVPAVKAPKSVQRLVTLLSDVSLIRETTASLGYGCGHGGNGDGGGSDVLARLTKGVLESAYARLKAIAIVIPKLTAVQAQLQQQFTLKQQVEYQRMLKEREKRDAAAFAAHLAEQAALQAEQAALEAAVNDDGSGVVAMDTADADDASPNNNAAVASAVDVAAAEDKEQRKADEDEDDPLLNLKPIEAAIADLQTQKAALDNELAKESNAFFQMVPQPSHANSAIHSISTAAQVQMYIAHVLMFLDLHVTKKLLLGAQLRLREIHPIDYCAYGLGVSLQRLRHGDPQYKAIHRYVFTEQSPRDLEIYNIFALSRRGEDERFAPFEHLANRTLLWHGSSVVNFNGILSQGLRIAPPEADMSGYMFGKGIYFADKFSKSYGYCRDFQGSFGFMGAAATQHFGGQSSSHRSSKCLLMCEVALGTPFIAHQSEFMETSKPGSDSTYAVGHTGPDPFQTTVTAEGMRIPNGKIVPVEVPAEWQAANLGKNYFAVSNAEYIMSAHAHIPSAVPSASTRFPACFCC